VSTGFHRVKLMNGGGFRVVEGEVPEFNEPPEVVVWGERFFRYEGTGRDGTWLYREAFTVALVKTDEANDQKESP
jgi:hypothetical protein